MLGYSEREIGFGLIWFDSLVGRVVGPIGRIGLMGEEWRTRLDLLGFPVFQGGGRPDSLAEFKVQGSKFIA